MKKVDIGQLQSDTIAECNYYSHRSKLLIGKGTLISEKSLQTLAKRNVFSLYIKPSQEEELLDVISKEIKELDELDIETRKKSDDQLVIDGLVSAFDKKDYDQLINSELVSTLDEKIDGKDTPPSTPTGTALKANATQLKVGERTDEYLNGISNSYEKAKDKVRSIFNLLVQGNTNCAPEIKSVIKQFTEIFCTDKNIILNISAINPGAEEYLYYHSLNVCILSINIAASYGYNKSQVIEIGTGAMLHDIGMLLIPEAIRYKNSRYNKEDWYEIQKHPVLALHLLEKIKDLPDSVLFTAYQVHERINSSGYPKQRCRHLIHRFAQLVQVADIYEALSSPRPHRRAFLPYEAVDRLIKMTQAKMIASEFVKAFITYTSLYPIGSLVLLDNQCIAKVIDANHKATSRPVVSVLTDSNGSFLPRDDVYQLDLNEYTDFKIVQALSLDTYKNITIMDGF